MKGFITYIKSFGFWGSFIAIGIGVILYFLLQIIINNFFKNKANKLSKKKVTYQRLFKNILKYVVIIIVLIIILEINGVNVKALLAGLGIASVIAGLALQDALKDIIMGFNLITDDYFFVDDVIKIGNIEGKVLSIGLKNTKIKDTITGDVYIIANRNVSDALILAPYFGINLSLPYEEKIVDMEKFIDTLLKEIITVEHVEKAEYRGIEEFSSSSIEYRLIIYVKPEFRIGTKRKVNRVIKTMLDKYNLSIPYQQIDIHNKK